MKPIACFLVTMLLFLMAQPLLLECRIAAIAAVEEKSCSEMNSCSRKTSNLPEKSDDCDRSSTCNPFASCSQCQFITRHITYPGNIVELLKKSLPVYDESLTTGYLASCWQPPDDLLVS